MLPGAIGRGDNNGWQDGRTDANADDVTANRAGCLVLVSSSRASAESARRALVTRQVPWPIGFRATGTPASVALHPDGAFGSPGLKTCTPKLALGEWGK
eukprot:CAMPEP_0115381354 /NCGR_PEP_ID=MMETSP0271-20121206/5526_1 /TAXON_ID=71861 /ORGANISM="Scrippsiella trochoidea, Strain CCMP3099" /LENGTH=98 /DNA_ID=CAMNT_0002804629 /DNA_START=995 /DNA_END=1291 /DNA_ORIENTATION=+